MLRVFRDRVPNGQDRYGNTPLHTAAFGGDRETVQTLLDAGADVMLLNDP